MDLTVNRLLQQNDTLSVVEVNGRLKYYGMEPISCIDEGTYALTWSWSNDHGIYLPLVNNVPGHAGIEIHVGNFPTDTRDCLCLAENIATLQDIANSKLAINEFYPLFKADADAGIKSYITYRNLF